MVSHKVHFVFKFALSEAFEGLFICVQRATNVMEGSAINYVGIFSWNCDPVISIVNKQSQIHWDCNI